MNTMTCRLLVTLMVVPLGLSALHAQNGWKIVDQSGEVTIISNGRLKQSWGDDAMLMDGKKNRITFLSSEKNAFAEGTPEEYCALLKEVQDAMMAKLPAEQRSMIEGMRKQKSGSAPPKVVVKPQGSGASSRG